MGPGLDMPGFEKQMSSVMQLRLVATTGFLEVAITTGAKDGK